MVPFDWNIPAWFPWAIIAIYVGLTAGPAILSGFVSSLLLPRVRLRAGLFIGSVVGLISLVGSTSIAVLIGTLSNATPRPVLLEAFIGGAIVVAGSAVIAWAVCYLRNAPGRVRPDEDQGCHRD